MSRHAASPTELEVTAEDVRREHMAEADATAHRLYLALVLGGATLLMLGFMALLDTLT